MKLYKAAILIILAFSTAAAAEISCDPVTQKAHYNNSTGSWECKPDQTGGGGGAVFSVFGRTGDVMAAADDYSWTQIASKPSTFPPDAHGHTEADVTNLVSDLAGKSAVGHGHTEAEITNLVTDLGAKVPASRRIDTTTPLQGGDNLTADRTFSILQAGSGQSGYLSSTHWSLFNDKENALTFSSPLSRSVNTITCPTCSVSGHAHAEADVTNLVTDLAAKEATANKNVASGYAGLTVGTKLTTAQGQEVWAVTDLTSYATTSGTGTQAILATITTPAANNVLTWSGTNWINQAPAGGGESENIVRTTADVTNSTTTFADVTGLTFSATANKDYIFEAWLIFQSNTAGTGIKFAVNGPASPVAVVLNAHIPIALTLYASDSMMASRAYDTGTPSVSVDTINANLLAHVIGIFRNGTTTGPFTIRFAAETTGTVKVMTGSVLRYRQVN